MVPHQPGDQAGIKFTQTMMPAESNGILDTQFRMVATPALGDIMEQGCEVKNFQFGNGLDNLAAEREFAAEFSDCETSQIT